MNLCREKTGREDASQHATTKKCLSATPRARKTAGQQREDPRRLECHFALFRNRPLMSHLGRNQTSVIIGITKKASLMGVQILSMSVRKDSIPAIVLAKSCFEQYLNPDAVVQAD